MPTIYAFLIININGFKSFTYDPKTDSLVDNYGISWDRISTDTTPPGYNANTATNQGVELISDQETYVESGRYRQVTGTVKNYGSRTAKMVLINAYWYTNDVRVGYGNDAVYDLAPGEAAKFTVKCYDRGISKADTYKVVVEE